MQDIGPDMEDLLRRASEHYPLKQSEDRWKEIASKINSNPKAQPVKKHSSGRQKYYAMLLILLMFLFLYFFLSHPISEQRTNEQRLPGPETQEISEKKIPEKAPTRFKPARSQGQTDVNDNIRNGDNSAQFINNGTSKETRETNTRPIQYKTRLEQKEVFVRSTQPVRKMDHIHAINESIVVYRASSMDSLRLSRSQPLLTSLASSTSKNVTDRVLKRGFYYGLFLGPGYNTVKRQAINKAGFNIGLIGGYRLSNRVSVETGLSLSEKKYVTAGAHFSMEEIGPAMPPPMKLMDVRGTSQVIQIPVHFRYDIFQSKNHHFFSSAGLSSFVLTKESNEYHISKNGTEAMMYGTYKINKSYLAASIDLSVGYERNFGNNNNIRLQPYIQLPVKGIGVGDIQVLSTGFHIAITRSTH